MFEVIDPSVTVTGRPISQWIGDVTRQNVIELAERGAGGGYVWSVPLVNANGNEIPSAISSHPDYYYSIPFLILSPAYQTELTVQMEVIITGGIDVALWCEGSASSVVSGIGNGSHTLTLTIPPRPANGDLRCALLFQSQVGALLGSGAITNTTNRGMRSTTSTLAAGPQKGTHLFIELDAGTAAPVRGWQGESRYHAMRGERRSGGGGHDDFEVWPSPDQSLQDAVAYSAACDVYQLGTMTLLSMQARLETAALTGLPQPDETYPTQPVRATWLQRIARYLRSAYLTAPQYAWIGGVGGYNRSTGLSPASSVSPYRFWGAYIPRQATDILSTAIRARTGVDGIVISMLYTCVSPVQIDIEFDGVAVTSIVLPAAPGAAQKRNAAEDAGTLSFRHAPLTRDQCGSQDIGLHGTELQGLNCDTARFRLATIQQEWSVITPTVGDLVRVTVSAISNDKSYIAAISMRELGNDLALADMNNPAIAPLQPIETVSWDNLRLRMLYLYESRMRCVYSECNDTLLTAVEDGTTSTLAIISYTTSPDLPYGLPVLRFTVDAECVGAGTLTVALTDGVTTVSLVFTARAVLTGDLAVTSNTSYTLGIGGISSALTADGKIYLMRIEEIYP